MLPLLWDSPRTFEEAPLTGNAICLKRVVFRQYSKKRKSPLENSQEFINQ